MKIYRFFQGLSLCGLLAGSVLVRAQGEQTEFGAREAKELVSSPGQEPEKVVCKGRNCWLVRPQVISKQNIPANLAGLASWKLRKDLEKQSGQETFLSGNADALIKGLSDKFELPEYQAKFAALVALLDKLGDKVVDATIEQLIQQHLQSIIESAYPFLSKHKALNNSKVMTSLLISYTNEKFDSLSPHMQILFQSILESLVNSPEARAVLRDILFKKFLASRPEIEVRESIVEDVD